ncbi:zinc-binding metallopeptidase family protein [Aldersonia kunmingensis]|uniref:zinc-binding metallopeptidase family protein n=1 Tax=Aldersonia kunmingensis TaxID=408066 RepID=UPI000835A46A|nr:putative zinc-binding metallopeptidase [Aldersonia kunmingensis]
MIAFACPRCRGFVAFEDKSCKWCGCEVALHLPSESMVLVEGENGAVTVDGSGWHACSNRHWLCNWLVADDSGTPLCLACSLVRRRPDSDDTIAMEKLAEARTALRRLVFQLRDLELPITPFYDRDGGLAFDLLSTYSNNEKVLIGHANGVITIDLVETLDDYRERLRVALGEPYRTMLGHFRHEIGHYYQAVLVRDGALLDRCRELFGDERASYSDALDRHYEFGAPEDWRRAYISEYATMHPWEDFAECFAHYLHITDTLQTTAEAEVVWHANPQRGYPISDVVPQRSYRGENADRMLWDWTCATVFFNLVNRSMGKSDLYPFEINGVVAEKISFVHDVVRHAADRNVSGAR